MNNRITEYMNYLKFDIRLTYTIVFIIPNSSLITI